MQLGTLDRLLNQTPLIAEGMHPASLAYLSEPVTVYSSLTELSRLLDTPMPTRPHRALSFDDNPHDGQRFPRVRIDHNPFTPALNDILLNRYDLITASMLTHAKVADRIVAASQHFETVVLVLLDGLSYADCYHWPHVEPCLATHPTITRVGFPALIGSPPLAARLFSQGFSRRVGFTYWNRNNDLTDILFRTITETRRLDPRQPHAFGQVIDWISQHNLAKTYVQIVRTGLDEYATGHREVVPRQAIIGRIYDDLEAILNILTHKGSPAVLFAVADHGLLWRDEGHLFESIPMPGARYMQAETGPGRGRRFDARGQTYWVLDYPQMGRPLRQNEQGIHGGLSFQESIVPFIHWEVE